MNKYKIVFSPTGGTEKVAKAITKEWDKVEDIDLTIVDKDYNDLSLTNDDIAVIAMPSFGGIAPQLALDRLAKIKANNCRCFMLDHLFHDCKYKNAFVFKGGTSLSKSYHVIERFSEDIDLILNWRKIINDEVNPWEERSKTKI